MKSLIYLLFIFLLVGCPGPDAQIEKAKMYSLKGFASSPDDLATITLRSPSQVGPSNSVAFSPNDLETRKLFVAVLNRKIVLINEAIREGADKDAVDIDGYTSLMYAAFHGHMDTVKALLKAGVDKEIVDIKDFTALILASIEGHTDAVKALLRDGANKDVTDKKGWTALMWAAFKGRKDTVKALLKAGVDKTVVGKKGLTALTIATREGHRAVANLIDGYPELVDLL